jgi:hypothetical protein
VSDSLHIEITRRIDNNVEEKQPTFKSGKSKAENVEIKKEG